MNESMHEIEDELENETYNEVDHYSGYGSSHFGAEPTSKMPRFNLPSHVGARSTQSMDKNNVHKTHVSIKKERNQFTDESHTHGKKLRENDKTHNMKQENSLVNSGMTNADLRQ